MRRKRNTNDEGSLDSLLDTMTNVVGILVLVLIIVMLSVNDAVQQIIRAEAGFDQTNVSEQDITAAGQKVSQVRLTVETLSKKEQDMTQSTANAKLELVDLQEELEKMKSTEKNDTPPPDPEQLKKLIAEQEKVVKELESKTVEAEQQVADLENKLAEAPKLEDIAAHVVKLPDPRPAPENATMELFIVREKRVLHLDMDKLKNIALRQLQKWATPDVNGEVDCEKLIENFAKREIGDENFILRLDTRTDQKYLFLIFERRKEAGDTLADLESDNNKFMQTLRRMNRKRQFCRFTVWIDSFEEYVKARSIVDEREILAGWAPTNSEPEYAVYFAEAHQKFKFKCKGNKPPPPPDPNRPAGPPPPPKPVDVID